MKLTRRRFLIGTAAIAIGGAAIAIGRTLQDILPGSREGNRSSFEPLAYPQTWTPIEEQLRRIRQANDPDHPRDVTILGAGISGLTAAYVLRELGHTVKIYEANDRIGGRIYTHRFPEDPDHLYGELGAMRIPASHDYTLYFINLLNLETRDFITSFANDQAFLDMRGKASKITDGQENIYPLYRLTAQELDQYPAGKIFGAHLQEAINSLTYEEQIGSFEGNVFSEKLQILEATSLGDFVEGFSISPDTKELVGNFIGLQGWWDKSLGMFVRDTIVDTTDGLQEIVGGMGSLTESVAETMPNVIQKNREVTSIRNMKDGVELSIRSTNPDDPDAETIKCDYVLCTIPFSVLRRMDLTGIDALKMRAISSMEYAAATKVLLNCRERFWETKYDIFGGASTSDRISRWTYYPSDHADANRRPLSGFQGVSHILVSSRVKGDLRGGPGVLLASYSVGQDAIRLGSLSDDEAASVVMESISHFHPEILDEGMVIGHKTMAWNNNKWSSGAFAFLWPNQLKDIYQACWQPAKVGHFC